MSNCLAPIFCHVRHLVSSDVCLFYGGVFIKNARVQLFKRVQLVVNIVKHFYHVKKRDFMQIVQHFFLAVRLETPKQIFRDLKIGALDRRMQ